MSVLHDFVEDIKQYKEYRRAGNKVEARKKLKYIIFTGLATVATVVTVITLIIGAIRRYVYSPSPSPTQVYKIAVVGPETGSEKATWNYILNGIKTAQLKERIGKVEGSSLKIDYFDDAGNVAISQDIARKICADPGYVLVMGFVESSVAKPALPIYSNCGLSVILVATTSTTLTAANKNQWSAPVLRLPPSNDQQAVQVVNALGDTFGTNPCRLVVFLDGENKEYSDNLLEQFRNVLGADKRTRCTIQSRDVEVFKAGDLEQPLTQNLAGASSADVILFFGMTDKATKLLAALDKVRRDLRLPKTKPIVVLSDGSTTSNLIDEAKESARCVWGSFPYGEARDFMDNIPHEVADIPSFFAYGHDALLIAMNTISDVGDKVTRETIKVEFQKLAKEKETLRGMNGIYEFAYDGGLRFFLDPKEQSRILGQYHLWQVRSLSGTLRWDHRTWRDSLAQGCPD
ncbi:MAG TPA: ABC transporter substrate-binding protein [Pyrinomonadaceae bacterium]